jgi:signal transduction histidine kinase
MDAPQTIEASASSLARGPDRFFDGVRKKTAIQLRWPLVVVCTYLLLYSPAGWLAPNQTHAILIFYLLTNATLYFIAYQHFDSPYFYGSLLVLDAVLLTLGLTLGGASTPDFYLACFCTVILGCICNDSRGLLAVTLLAPALYAYVVFSAGAADAPRALHLRFSVPFVISLFYGYFAQIERLRRRAMEKEELAAREQKAAEEIRAQREHLKVMQEVNRAVTATVDVRNVLESFLEKALAHLPYSAAIIRLRNRDSGVMETGAVHGIPLGNAELSAELHTLANKVATLKETWVGNLTADPQVENAALFRKEGLVFFIGVPLMAEGESLGSLVFLARQQLVCGEEEIDFLATVAAQAAVVIQQAQLFQQIQQQASELRNANRLKDEFLGLVSHELRTPLNVISGYTNMLMEGMLGEITPIQEKALHTMLRQTKDLHATINSVLQVSCIEAELVQPELHETNFWEFLYEIKSYYDYPLANDVKLVWNFPSDLPTLMADRGKLRQILHNLINNAIKFTHQGSVTLSAQYLHAKKCMEFKVADSGIGISREELPHIFEKFRQLDSSDTKNYGGVGLGLYIVKKCTEILHGTIHVESKPGKGSTFTLRVPCHGRKAAETPLPAMAAAG